MNRIKFITAFIFILSIELFSYPMIKYFRHVEEMINYEYQFKNEIPDTLAAKSFCYYVKFDSLSQPVHIEYQKCDNIRIYHDNVAITKIEYDGNLEKRSYYNEQNQPTYRNNENYHSIWLQKENRKIVLASFYDIEENQIRNSNLFYKQFVYNDSINEIKVFFLNKRKNLILINNIYEKRYLYDKDKNCIMITYHNKIGELQNDDDDIAIVRKMYANKGKTRKEFYYNMFDEQIEIAENTVVRIYNKETKKINVMIYKPIAGAILKLDKNGYLALKAYFDLSNKYTHDKKGVAVYKYKTNNYGQMISKSHFNGQQQACENTSRVHKYEYVYDEAGNRVEEKRCRINEEYYQIKNMIPIIKMEYDGFGYKIRETYFDKKGKPISNSIAYGYLYEYDQFANIVETVTCNKKGNPCVYDHQYSSIMKKYDQRNNLIEKKYLKLNGKLANPKQSWAFRNIERDYDNNVIVTKHYNRKAFSDDLALVKMEGYYEKKETFNDLGKLIKTEFFDKIGDRTNNKNKYSILIFTYDESGNVIENCFYDKDENLVVPKHKVFAKLVQKFDSNGFQIKKKFYDENEKLTLIDEGIAAWTKKINDKGEVTEVKYFGTNHELVTPKKKKYASYEKSYNSDGDLIEHKFFDEKGKLVNNKYGYAIIRLSYFKKHKINELRYYNQNEELFVSKKDKCAIVRGNYNTENKLEEIEYLNCNEELTNITFGFFQVASIRFSYNEKGVKKDKSYYNKNGEFVKKFKLSKSTMLYEEIYNFLFNDED